jgi:hypothetical protein
MSRTLSGISLSVPVAALMIAACGAAAWFEPARAEATQDASKGEPAAASAHWEPRKLDFTYVGFTSRYSCDGLEGQVRFILRHFGAGKDVKVKATGCDNYGSQVRPENLSRMAWVHAEFSALEPGPDANGASMPAQWSKVLLTTNHPLSMGLGECELVQSMRPMLEKGFNLRDLQYRTDCVPKQVSVGDYFVQAEALRAEGPQANAH